MKLIKILSKILATIPSPSLLIEYESKKREIRNDIERNNK